MEGKSRREAEIILNQKSSFPIHASPEKVRHLNEHEVLVQFCMDQELVQILEEFKNLQGFELKNQSYLEVFKKMGRFALKELKKKKGIQSSSSSPKSTPPAELNQVPNLTKFNPNSRYISKPLKTLLWQRQDGKCAYTDPKTHTKCGSRYALQVEHIEPFALGGLTAPENLELLCPAHNQLRATQRYGEEKMRKYVG